MLGPIPLWAELCLGMCPEVVVSSLVVSQPVCLWVGLCPFSASCLILGVPALSHLGCWVLLGFGINEPKCQLVTAEVLMSLNIPHHV